MAGRARWRAGAWTAGLVAGAVLVLGCGVVRGPLSRAPEEPPAKPPADICALVGAELLTQLVPDATEPEVEAQEYSYTNYARCTVETDDEKAATTAQATLRLELTREGSTYSNTAAEEAGDTLDGTCESADEPLTDLGERGCVSVTAETEGQRIQVELAVLLGADVLEVSYVALPTTADRATSAARAVAGNVLARL